MATTTSWTPTTFGGGQLSSTEPDSAGVRRWTQLSEVYDPWDAIPGRSSEERQLVLHALADLAEDSAEYPGEWLPSDTLLLRFVDLEEIGVRIEFMVALPYKDVLRLLAIVELP